LSKDKYIFIRAV